MSVLPQIDTDAAFAKWRADPACWQPLVRMIAAAHGMPAEAARPFGTGTNLVLDLDGGSVLKVFPPLYRPQFTSERATLRRLAGRLPVPVPQLLAEGERDGWSWLLMSKLDGIVGSQAWPMLPEADKLRLIEEIGRTIAEVQAVPPGGLSALEPRGRSSSGRRRPAVSSGTAGRTSRPGCWPSSKTCWLTCRRSSRSTSFR